MPFKSAPAHSNRPHNAKKLFTLLFQPKFLKICFTKVAASRSFLMMQHFFSPCQVVPGACLSQIVTNSHTSNTHKHPQTPTNTHKTPTNTNKEWCYHTFVKEWMNALDKTRILAPSDYFYHFSFPRPGFISLNALLGRFSEKLTVTTLRKRGRSGVTRSGCLLKTSEEQAAELSECNQAIRSLTRRSREENF